MQPRKRAIAVGALLGLTAPLAFTAAPVFATTTGTFDVTVYDDKWNALPGATVTLYSAATNAPVGTPKTADANGTVEFTGLSDGTYAARASKANYHSRYTLADTVSDASPWGYASVSIPLSDAAKGRLKGTVTKPGTTYLDAEVEIYPASVTAATLDTVDSITTFSPSNDGIWGGTLPPGAYKVRVWDWDTGKTVWVGAANATADNATTITVTAGGTATAASVTLPSSTVGETPRITGTVTGAGGVKLNDVSVRLFTTDADDPYDYVASVRTNAAGAFSLSSAEFRHAWRCWMDDEGDYVSFLIADYGTEQATQNAAANAGCDNDDAWWRYEEMTIPAGSYRLAFVDSVGEYVSEFYNDVAFPSDGTIPNGAATVTVPTTGAVAISAVSLTKAPVTPVTAGLSGRVVTTSGAGVAAEVEIYNADTGRYAMSVQTRRDGTWGLAPTVLAPGTYKAWVGASGLSSTWIGGATQKMARTLTQPLKGLTNVGTVSVAPLSSVSGRVTTSAVAGLDRQYTTAYLYDADGQLVDWTSTSSGGGYTFPSVDPGTYYVSGSGYRSSLFTDDSKRFISQFWGGKYTLATAKPITLARGKSAASINITLGNRLLATTAASIAGTPKTGQTLTARAGTWNTKVGTSFRYQWKRGATVVGKAATYKVVKADEGKSLSLVVTAVDTRGDFVTGNSTAKAVKVVKPSKKKKKKNKKKKK